MLNTQLRFRLLLQQEHLELWSCLRYQVVSLYVSLMWDHCTNPEVGDVFIIVLIPHNKSRHHLGHKELCSFVAQNFSIQGTSTKR